MFPGKLFYHRAQHPLSAVSIVKEHHARWRLSPDPVTPKKIARNLSKWRAARHLPTERRIHIAEITNAVHSATYPGEVLFDASSVDYLSLDGKDRYLDDDNKGSYLDNHGHHFRHDGSIPDAINDAESIHHTTYQPEDNPDDVPAADRPMQTNYTDPHILFHYADTNSDPITDTSF